MFDSKLNEIIYNLKKKYMLTIRQRNEQIERKEVLIISYQVNIPKKWKIFFYFIKFSLESHNNYIWSDMLKKGYTPEWSYQFTNRQAIKGKKSERKTGS